ncbi:MAG: GWxTD domain-containing protein, partial [Thermoanaerobaculia bacterium]
MWKRSLLLALMVLVGLPAESRAEDDSVLWPEHQRAFLHDGPGLLLTEAQRDELRAAGPEERERWIEEFLRRDPLPDTPTNELEEGVRRRQSLVRREFLSLLDDRARLLFLHGEPASRSTIECGMTFKPLEIWTYQEENSEVRLVLYQPSPGRAYRLWLPLDSKVALYIREMAYWLEQWEELQGRIH